MEMLNVPRASETNGLLRSLDRLHTCMANKSLPDAARWITRTRLCWQRKKADTPRPIEMGEFLRSSFAKRYSKKYCSHVRRQLAKEHQWGVSIPGACEGLSHWRSSVEDLAKSGEIQPLIAADLDLANFFGSTEWDSIRDAIDEELVEVKAWTEWQHEQPSITVLPSGEEFIKNRGVGKGYALGCM